MAKHTTPSVAVGYVRVSTAGQAAEGVSLEAQRAAIERYAELHGLQLARIDADEGISAKQASNRPGLNKALAAVCRAKGVLVIHSLTRLARSTADAIAITGRLDRAGADLASISEKLDTTSAMGRFVFRLMASLGELEREQVSERTIAAMAHCRKQGKRISGRLPYGYVLGDDCVSLIEDAREQAVLADLRRWRSSGLSYPAIADRLNAEGIPAKLGGRWLPPSVRSVLLRRDEGNCAAGTALVTSSTV